MTEAYEIVCSSDDREKWLAHRKSGIGASEIAAVFGESSWMSAVELYAIKIGAEPDPDLSDNERVYWGAKLEPAIIDGYKDRTGRPVKRSALLLRSRTEPWAMCTLDGLTGIHEPEWPLEVKNAWGGNAGEWTEGPPRHYYLQVQQQLLVTGAPRATVACLLGGNRLVWCDIERDDVELRRISLMGRIFWNECVEAGISPKPDGSESAKRGLCALYPHAENAIVKLSADYDQLYEELSELKQQQRAIEKRREEIENQFRAALGSASKAVLPSRNTITWNEQRGTIDYKRAAEALGANVTMLEQYRRPPCRVLRQHDAKG